MLSNDKLYANPDELPRSSTTYFANSNKKSMNWPAEHFAKARSPFLQNKPSSILIYSVPLSNYTKNAVKYLIAGLSGHRFFRTTTRFCGVRIIICFHFIRPKRGLSISEPRVELPFLISSRSARALTVQYLSETASLIVNENWNVLKQLGRTCC